MSSLPPPPSNSQTQQIAPRQPNPPVPWTTEEELVLTNCWISVYQPVGPPHLHVGNDWIQLTHRFNNEMGPGKHRLQADVESKWVEMAEQMKILTVLFTLLSTINVKGGTPPTTFWRS